MPNYQCFIPSCPEATHINAFSISWQGRNFHAFPLFAVIGKVLHKIVLDTARGIIVVPYWPTQPWYSLLIKLLIDITILLYSSKTLFQHPAKSKPYPLAKKLNLLACVISSKNQEQQTFQQESIRIIQQSRRPSTTKTYDNYIGKWKVFCRKRGMGPISTSLDQSIELLTKIFESCVGYSSVGIALSSVLIMDNGISFGKHPLVQQFLKGIFNLRSALPRQFVV